MKTLVNALLLLMLMVGIAQGAGIDTSGKGMTL